MEKRIEKIKDFLKNGQAAIITEEKNRFYFLDFKSSAGVLVITSENAYFFIDSRYIEKARKTIKNATVILMDGIYNQLTELFKKEGINEVLIENQNTTLYEAEVWKKRLNEVDIITENDLSEKILELRQIKSKKEIEFINEAQKITDKAFNYILDFIKLGKTETEIAIELDFFMRKQGSDGIAFDTIVVSGKNSSMPHGVPTDKGVENGDFITMDFGAKYMGYCSDMTRTIALGDITEKQKYVYDTVLKAQKAALDIIKPERVCFDVDKAARDIIENAGFGDCFGHGLGHSLGLFIHENPACNKRDMTPLKKGMIMTVEPGIYLENEFGVRIEDMVLITDDGYLNFTKSPKNLIVL